MNYRLFGETNLLNYQILTKTKGLFDLNYKREESTEYMK